MGEIKPELADRAGLFFAAGGVAFPAAGTREELAGIALVCLSDGLTFGELEGFNFAWPGTQSAPDWQLGQFGFRQCPPVPITPP